jgi:hypothetical protein
MISLATYFFKCSKAVTYLTFDNNTATLTACFYSNLRSKYEQKWKSFLESSAYIFSVLSLTLRVPHWTLWVYSCIADADIVL